MFNFPAFGSGQPTQILTLFDSEKEGGAIAPGESKEKYVSLTAGGYQMVIAHLGRLSDTLSKSKYNDSETYGELCLYFFTEYGKLVASSMPLFPMVNFVLYKNSDLKLKVSRNGGTDRNSIHFYVNAWYSPEIF
ncbi:MAG: hypothetical protein KME26_27395 [Oscillatoria princeps RMCB-10]|jgi:hypothetical protein|nr:hypothetical protein [Oscillatoria princeps RMCB-10]